MTLREMFGGFCLVAALASGTGTFPSSSIELGANLLPRPIAGGDLLSISVYGAPELSRTVRVSEEGLIRLPMLKTPMEARGIPPRKHERRVSKALGDAGILVEPVGGDHHIAVYATHPFAWRARYGIR
jgi:hypothetical protein